MNNKQLKIVPKLRFTEFQNTEEWKCYKLSDISDKISEKVGNLKLTTLSISAGTGFVSQTEKFSRDISGKQYANYIHIKKGDFSYNKGNSKRFPQGCIYELKEYDEAAVPNAFISFRFRKDFVPSFYKGYFDNNFHGRQLIKYITSGARSDGLLNINHDDFFSIILPTPFQKAEQKKIADCLSSLDELIEAENKKLEVLQKHKKGLMQKLFPADGESVPKWRFPDFKESRPWKKAQLGEIAQITIGEFVIKTKQNDNSPYPVYNGGTSYTGFYDEFNNEGNKILVSARGVNAGFVNLIKTRYWAGNSCYSIEILDKTRFDIDFLYQEMKRNQSKFIDNQQAANIPSVSKGDVESFEIIVPDYKEQIKIADCLSEIDNLILAQTQRIEKLKKHKKGLMQGLFPSIEEVCK